MRTSMLWASILVVASWLAPYAAAQPTCASGWLPGYGESTFAGSVLCVQPFDFDGAGPQPVRYVMAGSISRAIDIAVQRIVAWDGQRAHPLGNGFNATVCALTVHNGQLIAAGFFTHSGSTMVNGIAAWNGESWQPIGNGLISSGRAVHSVVSHGGMLYAAGDFSGKLRRWDGATWSIVTGWNALHEPTLLRSYAGQLYVMGPFNRLNSGVVRFDGANWTTIPGLAGTDGSGIWSMEVIGDHLYIVWPTGSPVRTKRLHRWDGSTLEVLPMVHNSNDGLLVVAAHAGSVVVGGGFYPTATGKMFARFDNGAWTTFGPLPGSAPLIWMASVAAQLFAGDGAGWGYVDPLRVLSLAQTLNWPYWQVATRLGYHNGQVLANRGPVTQEAVIGPLTAWNGTTLSTMRIDEFPDLLASGFWRDGDALVVEGLSVQPSARRVLATLSGSSWTFEMPFPREATYSGFSTAYARWNGTPVVGFDFADNSTSPATRRARVLMRQSGAWMQLGPDLFGSIRSLAVRSDGLYAAGVLTGVDGGGPLSHVARWDGAGWQPVGGGLSGECDDLITFGDDLIAVGAFVQSGSTIVNYAAAWNGQSWRALANGLPGRAYRIRIVNQQPWAACAVSGRGRLYRWDGENWNLILEAQDGEIGDFVAHGGEVILLGSFLRPGGPSGPATARWARYSFNDAPVITNRVQNAAVCRDNTATITVSHSGVGPFTYQWRRDGVIIADGPLPDGTIVSGAATQSLTLTNIGAGSPLPFECTVTNACGDDTAPIASLLRCAADFNCSRTVTVQDILDFLAAYFAGSTAADFNLSGDVSIQDIFDYLAAYFAGC